VSLHIALHYIRNGLTNETIKVSIDGAHVKTKDKIHFDIYQFLKEHNCHKRDGDIERWQGVYDIEGYAPKLEISSVPGIGDVNISLLSGKQLWIESKKGKANKRGQEYVLMREAIGQLMTNEYVIKDVIPVVAVPYSDKSFALATKWSQLEQIRTMGICFFLVKDSGEIIEI
jgi:hypothetical protein